MHEEGRSCRDNELCKILGVGSCDKDQHLTWQIYKQDRSHNLHSASKQSTVNWGTFLAQSMFEQGASGGLVIYFLSPGRGGRGVLKYFGWVTIKNNLLPQQGSIILFASPPPHSSLLAVTRQSLCYSPPRYSGGDEWYPLRSPEHMRSSKISITIPPSQAIND